LISNHSRTVVTEYRPRTETNDSSAAEVARRPLWSALKIHNSWITLADKPVLDLEELNLKYTSEKPAKRALRARVPGGWLIFIETPGRGGLGGVTFYPDPNHAWDGGTQEA